MKNTKKIMKLGDSSFMVSLPKAWVIENNLKKGEVLEFNTDNNQVTYTSIHKAKHTTIFLDLSKNTISAIRTVLIQYYRQGYNKIEVKYNKKDDFEKIKQFIKDKSIGFDVVKKEDNRCIIEDIAEPSKDKFELVLKKLFFILKTESKEIYEELLNNNQENTLELRTENRLDFDKYTNFIRRMIILYQPNGKKKSYFLYYFTSLLSLIEHGYYYMYADILKHKIVLDKDSLEYLNTMNGYIDKLFTGYFKQNYTSLDFIFTLRDKYWKGDLLDKIEHEKDLSRVYFFISDIVRHIQMASTLIYGLIDENNL